MQTALDVLLMPAGTNFYLPTGAKSSGHVSTYLSFCPEPVLANHRFPSANLSKDNTGNQFSRNVLQDTTTPRGQASSLPISQAMVAS